MTVVPNVLVIVFTRLLLFDFALQVLDLVAVVPTDLGANGPRVVDHAVRLLETDVFQELRLGTTILD